MTNSICYFVFSFAHELTENGVKKLNDSNSLWIQNNENKSWKTSYALCLKTSWWISMSTARNLSSNWIIEFDKVKV